MLFRTRQVRKKYSKLNKKYRTHFFKRIHRNKLRNWNVFHRLKKFKTSYSDLDSLSFFEYDRKFLVGKMNYIHNTFRETLHISSTYCLFFQNFIKNNIFKTYGAYYTDQSNKIFSHFNMCCLSTSFFVFLIVKSKVYHLIHIFKFFKNYFIINFKTNYCYLIYYINGGLNDFYLFYLLYLRYVFESDKFEDIVFNDFSHLEFWSLLKQYSLLNQFYFSMLKMKNVDILHILSSNSPNLNSFDERTISEISQDEIEDKKLFDSFELEENESMLLDDYILYHNSNHNDYLSILKDDLSGCNFDILFPFIESSSNNNYLQFSLTVLNNINSLFFDNLESLEYK